MGEAFLKEWPYMGKFLRDISMVDKYWIVVCVFFFQTNTCRWVILLSGMCLLYHKEERTVGLEDDLGINENRIPWLEGYFSDGKRLLNVMKQGK